MLQFLLIIQNAYMEYKLIIAVLFGFLPGIIWLVYFYKKDSIEPEPVQKIIKAFGLGIFIALPAVFFETILISIVPVQNVNFFSTVVAAPIIEESLKYLAVFWVFYKDKDFDEPMDGIVYAVSVALGFAAIENLGYIYNSFSNDSAFMTILGRAFLSVPAHALFASVYGFGLGLRKFNHKSYYYFRTTLIYGIMLHALFNFLAILSFGISLIILLLMIGMWRKFSSNVILALKVSPHMEA